MSPFAVALAQVYRGVYDFSVGHACSIRLFNHSHFSSGGCCREIGEVDHNGRTCDIINFHGQKRYAPALIAESNIHAPLGDGYRFDFSVDGNFGVGVESPRSGYTAYQRVAFGLPWGLLPGGHVELIIQQTERLFAQLSVAGEQAAVAYGELDLYVYPLGLSAFDEWSPQPVVDFFVCDVANDIRAPIDALVEVSERLLEPAGRDGGRAVGVARPAELLLRGGVEEDDLLAEGRGRRRRQQQRDAAQRHLRGLRRRRWRGRAGR